MTWMVPIVGINEKATSSLCVSILSDHSHPKSVTTKANLVRTLIFVM